jgi:hypothetical protein
MGISDFDNFMNEMNAFDMNMFDESGGPAAIAEVMALRKIAALYRNAEKDLYFLECLRSAGVDNWPGYEYAWDEYDKLYPIE